MLGCELETVYMVYGFLSECSRFEYGARIVPQTLQPVPDISGVAKLTGDTILGT